ncbi:MAG TPA: type II toxin-antitoxin system HipA family toxin [Steroidobacteraceae bacterium]|nr:type II toxin-antitoxin system HipA family toxin [Steroidobacteraceae bacterium]
MARTSARTPLNVYLNSRLVGQLRKESSGGIDFSYDSSWLLWEHTFPISLSLPLRETRYTGDRVTAVFDNLLPDNRDIRKQLAQRVLSPTDDAYDLLSAIGRDCIGALQFLADGIEPARAGLVEGDKVKDERIESILKDLGRTPLGVTAEDADFRISVAGAQEKTALLFWKKAWHLPHASTATTHILKPQIGVLRNSIDLTHSVENEHLCMALCSALGLPTAKTQIVDFGKTRALAVERFDRRWTKDQRLLRLPQEDLCQALGVPPSRKYQPDGGPGMHEVLELLKASDDPDADRRLFLKAQIVFWLLGATDGHAKNFSIFLRPGGGFRLTPLYDVMSLQPAYRAGQVQRNRMKLAMSVGTQRHYVLHTIAPRHFMQTALTSGLAREVVEEVFADLIAKGRMATKQVEAQVGQTVPSQIKRAVFELLNERLKLLTPEST